MSVEQTRRTLDRYFGLMGNDEDFAECFTTDVTWLVADTGELIQGPQSVRDYIIALHLRMVDSQGRQTVIGEDSVYLEGIAPPRFLTAPESTTALPMTCEMTSLPRCVATV